LLNLLEEHALHAFEVHALDYLLKSINDKRFTATMEYVRRRLNSGTSHTADQRIKALLDQPLPFSDSSFAIRTGLRTKIGVMQAHAAAGDFSGSVLVARDGRILYQHAFGYLYQGSQVLPRSAEVLVFRELTNERPSV
jgi:hypothetical protein